MEIKVQMTGGSSKMIIIPFDIATYMKIEIGTKLDLEIKKDMMIFRKMK